MSRSLPPSGSIRTRVTVSGTTDYDAVVDPANRWNGWVSPYFTLDTVRRLSAEMLGLADAHGYDCADTVHVIDGGTDDDGEPRAIVLHIRWVYLADEGAQSVTSVVEPRTEDGLYCIGGWEWTWSITTWDCVCGSAPDFHETTCPGCGGERPADYGLAA
ncbi:hypothetical protein ACVW0K_007329 [Streptomyces filamentosus]